MPDITPSVQSLKAQSVVRVRPGQELAAAQTAKKNGADDVFFTIGQDTFVASGRGMALKGLKTGSAITHEGRQGTVTMIDNQVNTAGEGALKVLKPITIAAGGATAAGAAGGSFLGGLASAGGAGAAVGAAVVGIYAAGVAAVAVGGGALYGKVRDVDLESMKAHGH